MKINLHCHTNYSDGDDIFKMALEHKNCGFSAFVVTDHVYPLMLAKDKFDRYSMAITSYKKFQNQAQELKLVSEKLNFTCIQGMELALFGEEVLVFGNKVSYDIFNFLDNIDLKKQEKFGHTDEYRKNIIFHLVDILKINMKNSAYILCHPHLNPEYNWVMEPLYPILDGFEFQNKRCYFFTDKTNINKKPRCNRPIPIELINKNKFYNSDAHCIKDVAVNNGNFHDNEIKTLDDLINYIKTPQKQR